MNEKQSVLSSSMEALTQNIFGMLIGFLILTWYGLSVKQSIGLQSIFFVTSYIRSFVIRRLFNRFGQEIDMIKVKQLYVLWLSDDSDKKLIPYKKYNEFKSKLREAELLLNNEVLYTPIEDQCEDRMYGLQQNIYDLIDQYDTLEGEEVFVVLPQDVIKGED